ncbi:MAG: MmcQ/YjbR family DNA-binding protein [Bacteroidota bacterium]|nr:MmcQ/YjbR family DNA-binding protein [Bacteroidota bacterium]
MNIEDLRTYCLAKSLVTESFPFDEKTLVFKVCNKMFALTNIEDGLSVNLKCKPEMALELREQYPNKVLPGYHMNKKYWNTIIIDGSINDCFIKQWIDDSYELVVSKLTKKQRQEISDFIGK